MVSAGPNIRTFLYPFAFTAKVARGRERKARETVLSDCAPLSVMAYPGDGRRMAFVVDERQANVFFPVFRYLDRLWWPLLLDGRNVSAEEAFEGAIDLFGGHQLNDAVPSVDQIVTRWDASGRDRTVRAMQEKCADLLVVDGVVYAAGGVPLVACISRKFRVINAGGDRSGRPLETGLAAQPGRHGAFQTDFAIVSGKVWEPSDAALEEAYRRGGVTGRRKPIVLEYEPSAGDLFRVRLDAAFRLIDAALRRRGDGPNPSGYHECCILFERSVQPGELLDQRRAGAIRACFEVFGADWFDDTFPGCGRRILALLDSAGLMGLLVDHADPSRIMTDQDEAAIVSLSCFRNTDSGHSRD